MMWKWFYEDNQLLGWPLLTLLLFIAIFAVVVVRVARMRRDTADHAARLPLDEDDHGA